MHEQQSEFIDAEGRIVDLDIFNNDAPEAQAAVAERKGYLQREAQFRGEVVSADSIRNPGKAKRGVISGDLRIPEAAPMNVMKAYQDYFDMGSNRSLTILARNYREAAEVLGQEQVPTVSYSTLKKWHDRWGWELQVRHDELLISEASQEIKREEAKAATQRATRNAQLLQNIAMRVYRQYFDENGELTQKGQDVLTPTEARLMVMQGTKLERELRSTDEEIFDEESRY